jgi:UDPglucose 6-dehydrogenase
MDTTVTPVRLTVIGAGYLGLTHAVCMADLGHQVLAIDVDAQKIAQAADGKVPFFEPGLEPLLRKNVDAGRLRFSTSFAEAGEFGEIHFLCVGTPQASGGTADLSYLESAVGALAPHLAASCLLVGKSTVPVGTARRVRDQIRALAPAGRGVDLAWNPEFLREGHAVQDSLTPDRFVFGVTSEAAAGLLRRVYAKPLAAGVPALAMDLETAELVKVAANAFLAAKISFINAMAEVCEAAGAGVVQLAEALGYDERIGRKFLNRGANGLGARTPEVPAKWSHTPTRRPAAVLCGRPGLCWPAAVARRYPFRAPRPPRPCRSCRPRTPGTGPERAAAGLCSTPSRGRFSSSSARRPSCRCG